MLRKKRQDSVLTIARRYLTEHRPELKDAALRVRTLDGPPEAPRYGVTVEVCQPAVCPRGVPRAVADIGACTVHSCPLRDTVRLLISHDGEIVQVTHSGIHWGA